MHPVRIEQDAINAEIISTPEIAASIWQDAAQAWLGEGRADLAKRCEVRASKILMPKTITPCYPLPALRRVAGSQPHEE
jgi:hypothetical protein